MNPPNEAEPETGDAARLIAALRSENAGRRASAAAALTKLGPAAVPALVAALDGDSFLTWVRAARVLGKIGDGRAVGPLIVLLERALTGADNDVAPVVAEALGEIAEKDPVPALRDALPLLRNWTYIEPAATALARIEAALARLPQPETAPPPPEEQARQLVEQLRQTFPLWRDEIVRALIALGEPAVSPLIETLRWSPVSAVREEAAEALCAIGDARAVEPLLAALKDEMEAGTRGKMARRLQNMALKPNAGADPALTRPLLDALTAEAGDVQNLAFDMLVAAGPPAAPALVAALQDARGRIRRVAALILGHIAVPETGVPLRAACSDPDQFVRHAAVAALGRLNEVRASDIALLIEALGDNLLWIRRHTAAALGTLAEQGTPPPELRAALPPLRRFARSVFAGDEVRHACQKAVRQIEAVTAAFKDLPLPTTAAPASSAEGLPVPAAAPALTTSDLPVPATREAGDDKEPPPGWWTRLKTAARRRLG